MDGANEAKTGRFLKLFVDNQKTIYSYIFAMVYDNSVADDVFQDTTALMWERFESYVEGTNFGAWGITIARYKLMDHFKQNRHKYASMSDELLETINLTAQNHLETIDQRIPALRKCIGNLRDQDRKLLEIRYEKEMKVKEIAEKVNRPIQGLYQAMSRIHHTLLRCIEATLRTWEHDL